MFLNETEKKNYGGKFPVAVSSFMTQIMLRYTVKTDMSDLLPGTAWASKKK